eukprot:1368137-Prymnesium_polylepis.1
MAGEIFGGERARAGKSENSGKPGRDHFHHSWPGCLGFRNSLHSAAQPRPLLGGDTRSRLGGRT